MKKKLFIHIGMPKTGGTTIRETLKENKNLFLDYGIVHTRLFNIILDTHYDRVPRYSLKKNFKELCEIHLQNFYNKYFNDKNIHTYLINDDFFTNPGLLSKKDIKAITEIIKKIFKSSDFNIKIIVYLRRQDYWIESLYINYLRVHYHKKFSEFLKFFEENDYINYSKTLDIYASIFGIKNIIVENFDNIKNNSKKNSLWKNYLKHINSLTPELLSLGDNVFLNKKIAHPLIEFKRLLNPYLTDNEKWFYYTELNAISKSFNNDSFTYFSSKQRKKLLQKCKKTNSYISKKYLINDFDKEVKKVKKVKNKVSNKELTNIFSKILKRKNAQEPSRISKSNLISLFYNNIAALKDGTSKYILYGLGSSGKIIDLILKDQIVKKVDSNTINQTSFENIEFDYIIISCIGREQDIIPRLTLFNISNDKVIILDLKGNF